jgi:transcriptional regulator with XRE-family HTH domain
MGRGRPSKFNEKVREQMLFLYKKGKTDAEVAAAIGVSEKTINNWKAGRDKKEFLQSIKENKRLADDFVVASLFSRACGYSHPEEKVFLHEGEIITHETVKHYPPDTAAAYIWLKNRCPKEWREKQAEEATINISLTLADKVAKARLRSGK